MKDEVERGYEIAAFRYLIIAEAAEIRGGDNGVTAAICDAASQSYVDPDERSCQYGPRTLWRWLAAYKKGGLIALLPRTRKDRGRLVAVAPELLEKAADLRRQKPSRATKSIIDILERQKHVPRGGLARSTLDRHLDRMGLSRRRLHALGKKTYRKIKTEAPFELVIADFHHGPYVRVGPEGRAKKALLLAFIDHYSRWVPEARYYLHEDFAALRFGFRRVLATFGLFARLYVDNGPSFQTVRFHAACNHEAINIELVHSKPYVAEGRGLCERFNRTTKEQFEDEVRGRDELLTIDELNAYFEAWLAERYHRDVHSETGESPQKRLQGVESLLRPAPDLAVVDELLRLRAKRDVHKKWSTVELHGLRYVVDPALRGRKVHVLYDVFDQTSVLIEFDRRIVQRAYPQKAGEEPPPLPVEPVHLGPSTDYLALLRADYEARAQAELSSLWRRPPQGAELRLVDLIGLIETCRGSILSAAERNDVGAFFRKMRPIDPDAASTVLDGAARRLGTKLHVRVYLDVLQTALVRQRTKGDRK